MKRTEMAAETEAALKAAAKRVFAARGYLNAKITDITAEAGRAAGSFYNHFASKEELLEALLADMLADSALRASAPDHKPDFTDPDAIRWHVRDYVGFYRENAATLRAMQQAALVSETFARTLAEYGATERADLMDHVEHITHAGLRLPASPEVSLQFMHGLLDTCLQTGQQLSPDLDDEELTEVVTRFVYRGLTGRDY
ncbi:TetR/AcrR family transcriptional regulator [Streptomyces sp. NPDC059398]|uniref:TetR/AcrR family transcriptional regulator n=1 Tax=Streptomyces sp. NPDC059398 TaxID=3346820 RepID=UPI0036C94DD5